MSDDKLDIDELGVKWAFGNTIRHNYDIGDGYVSFSAPKDSSQEDLDKMKVRIQEITNTMNAFKGLPEAEQLRFYLHNLASTCFEIVNKCTRPIDLDNRPKTDMEKSLDKLRGDIFCMLDLALCEVSSEIKGDRKYQSVEEYMKGRNG